MKKSDHDEILTNILRDEALETLRQTSLDRGLGLLHRRRQRRRTIELAAAAVVALLAIFAATIHGPSKPNTQTARQAAPLPTVAGTSHAHYINQQELFALFPNRPIAIIGKPGHQQVVFLDEIASK